MLYYLPLEPYRERYTMQLSAPDDGWYERNWKKHGVAYKRIEPIWARSHGDLVARNINTGVVLDAVGRSRWAMAQIDSLLCHSNTIKDSDVVFLDDFWHPGVQALPYCWNQMGMRPRVYAYLWAQSVDQFDFTHRMRSWMRGFETGTASFLDGIFVASTYLKELLVYAGIAPASKIHVVGLPFDSDEVMSRMPTWYQIMMGRSLRSTSEPFPERKNKIVWSSRWDREKNPDFFLKVIDELQHNGADYEYVVCTGARKLRSNDDRLLDVLREYKSRYVGTLHVKENLTKEEYYAELCSAKVQFNAADQDWVSFTLLEASVAGCLPVYPYFRSFPETLNYENAYLYQKGDVKHAAEKVRRFMDSDREDVLWDKERINARSWIHKRHDPAWFRMVRLMGLPWNVSAETETLCDNTSRPVYETR